MDKAAFSSKKVFPLWWEKTGEKIIQLLFEVNRESGTTIVLVTHDMALARRCERIVKLQGGRLEELS